MPRSIALAVLISVLLAACNDSAENGAPATVVAAPTTMAPTAPREPQVTLLAVSDEAILLVVPEAGAALEIIALADLGIPADANRPRIQLIEGVLWVASGPGRLVGLDPTSGAVSATIEFGSTEPIADFAFRGSLLWVLVGMPEVDARVLAVDRVSGGLVFALEPPPGRPLGAFGVGEDGVWVVGGAPPSITSISEIDPGAGLVAQAVDTGLNVTDLLVAGGSVWAGGGSFAEFNVDARLVRIDVASGEVLATIEVGAALRGLVEAEGSIWVTDAGADQSGAMVYRIDPRTNTVVQRIEIGAAGKGRLDIIAGGGRLLAINSAEQRSYLIDATTGEVLGVVTGPDTPVALP